MEREKEKERERERERVGKPRVVDYEIDNVGKRKRGGGGYRG